MQGEVHDFATPRGRKGQRLRITNCCVSGVKGLTRRKPAVPPPDKATRKAAASSSPISDSSTIRSLVC
jgi:hypothetical protein